MKEVLLRVIIAKVIVGIIFLFMAYIVVGFAATGGIQSCGGFFGESCPSKQFCKGVGGPDAGGVCLPDLPIIKLLKK